MVYTHLSRTATETTAVRPDHILSERFHFVFRRGAYLAADFKRVYDRGILRAAKSMQNLPIRHKDHPEANYWPADISHQPTREALRLPPLGDTGSVDDDDLVD